MPLKKFQSRARCMGLLIAAAVATVALPARAAHPDEQPVQHVDRSRTVDAQTQLLVHLNNKFIIESPRLPQNEIPERFEVAVTIDGAARVVSLVRTSVRNDSFHIIAAGEGGKEVFVQPEPERTYQGSIKGLPDARVAAYLYDNHRISMGISIGDERWDVQPIDALKPGSHVVYQPRDLVGMPVGTCGVHDAVPPAPGGRFVPRGPGGPTTSKIVIICDCDYEFYGSFSGVQGAINEMQRIINEVNTAYSDKGICYAVGLFYVRQSNSQNLTPTNADQLLSALRSFWSQAPYNTDGPVFFHQVVHLFTYKNLDGSTVGIAYTGTILCQTAPVPTRTDAFSLSSTASFSPDGEIYPDAHRVEVCAHELGHNWGLRHCDQAASGCGTNGSTCGIMTSSFDPGSPGRTAFSACSHNQLVAFRAAYAACAGPCGASSAAVCLGWCSYESVASANASAPVGSTIPIYPYQQSGTTGAWPENITLNRPMTYTAGQAPVRIGH